MPKYCSVLSCRNDTATTSEHKSFYKFPLHDRSRLQLWLRNMGREGWTPSRHQYICHKHFTDSCFKVSWGIRYLDHSAVPTVFKVSEKRKEAVDLGEKAAKYRRTNGNLRIPELPELDNTDRDGGIMDTLHFYNINVVDPSQCEATLPVESHDDTEEPLGGCEDDPPVETFDLGGVLCHAAGGSTCLDAEGNTQVLVILDEVQEQLLGNGFTHGHQLLIPDSCTLAETEASSSSSSSSPGRLAVQHVSTGSGDDEGEGEASVSDGGHQVTQVIAYFETIPNVFPVNGRFSAASSSAANTVLCSALGYKPIASTLPIVSKYIPPPPPLPASPGAGVEAGVETGTDSDEAEKLDVDSSATEKQLEEHCYFRSSRLSKEGLEAAVCDLQRKVKVLQQRHRRHLDKLLGLEATVSQLRRHNLLHEERLQLLEKAYLQTSAVVSDAGETAAMVYEYDSAGPRSDEDD